MRTGFVVGRKRVLDRSIITLYEYLKTKDPVSIDVLGYMRLFSEEDYLAPPAPARYEPMMDEKLTEEELRDLMAAPGEEKRRSGSYTEASA